MQKDCKKKKRSLFSAKRLKKKLGQFLVQKDWRKSWVTFECKKIEEKVGSLFSAKRLKKIGSLFSVKTLNKYISMHTKIRISSSYMYQ